VCVGWLLAILLAAVGVPVAPAAAEPHAVSTTDVTFVGGGGVVLHGIVVAPRPSGKRRPALVMLEGAGNRGRQELQPAAEVFARHGVITLIYDKRKVGYSLLRRDYGLLATLTIGFAFYPLAGLVGHIRTRSMSSGLGGTQRLMVAAGLFTTLGLPVYLLFLMITAANVIGPVVVGRPLRGSCSKGRPRLSASAQPWSPSGGGVPATVANGPIMIGRSWWPRARFS
jgi:hypothetical protein